MAKEMLIKNKDDIIKLYVDGLTQQQIADKYNTSKSSIARLLHRVGITSKVIITEFDEQQMIEMYKNGTIIKDIANEFNIGDRRVSDILKKYNIQIVPSYERQRKYSLNESYFDCIDTQDKAYLLGLLYADGCNSNGHIAIRLQEIDRDILCKMNIILGSDRPLRFIDYSSRNNSSQNQYSLDIVNQHMSNQLSLLGMVPNKSLILEFPQWMNAELYPHFIRGYFDGDGYVSKNYNNAKLSIISTKAFCEKVKDILYKDIGINACIYLCHKNESTTTRALQISGRNQIKKFLDYIYNNANLYLDRKYNIYQSLYADKNNTLAV